MSAPARSTSARLRQQHGRRAGVNRQSARAGTVHRMPDQVRRSAYHRRKESSGFAVQRRTLTSRSRRLVIFAGGTKVVVKSSYADSPTSACVPWLS